MDIEKLIKKRKDEIKEFESIIDNLPIELVAFMYGFIGGLKVNIRDLENLKYKD